MFGLLIVWVFPDLVKLDSLVVLILSDIINVS